MNVHDPLHLLALVALPSADPGPAASASSDRAAELALHLRDEFPADETIHVVADMEAAKAYLREHHDVDAIILRSADAGVARAQVDHLRRLHKETPVVVLATRPEVFADALPLRGQRLSEVVPVPWRDAELAITCRRLCAGNRRQREFESSKKQLHRRLELFGLMNELTAEIADADSLEALARILAQGLFRVSPSGIGAGLLYAGDRSFLHIYCPHACAPRALDSTRQRVLDTFRSVSGIQVPEERLLMDIGGGGKTNQYAREHTGGFTYVPVALDNVTVGVIALATDTAITPALEKLMFFMGSRAAETCRRLALREQGERERLALLFESMGDGVIFYNHNTEHVLINPAARELLDIDRDREVDASVLESSLGFQPLDRVGRSGRRPTQMVQESTVNGRPLRVTLSSVADKDGVQVGVGVVLRDLSEAEELSRRQSEFISLISHELRTPITSIAGILDMMLKGHAGLISDRQQRYLELAHDSCTQLDGLVKNILDVARSEREQMLDQLSPLDLGELSRDVVARYRDEAEARRLSLELRSDDERIRILGDGPRLSQVLDNLLANALKFTPAGGEILVRVFRSAVVAEHVGISVFNTGAPIPQEARDRIFEKFEQVADLSTREVGGAGLGLAIARAIIDAHGGRLWVESLDRGTRFVFILPVAPSTDEQVDERISERPTSPSGRTEKNPSEPADKSDIQVLVVDDVVHSGFMLSGLLMGAGYQVVTVKDAESALTHGRVTPPQLTVVSLDSAASGNADLAHIAAHDPQMRKTAMLLLSPDPRVADIALHANADFLAMPVEQGEFLDTCAKIVHESARAEAHRVLVVDDDATIRLIVRDVLEGAGYDVYDAGDGSAALELAKRCKPHVMLLDIMMPRMDGFQTATILRADPTTSMTPIIFVSARGETADKVRAFKAGAEDYMVKPFDADELVARVSKSVARQARELSASPTTQLPGAAIIETEIETRLKDTRVHAFCYLDLDNLKAFNDYYGYAKADGIIRQTGDIIRDVVAREGSPGDFIGHIAGDDFVFITSAERVGAVCGAICSTFDRLVPLYYDRADRERGYIETKDRWGVVRQFPIMTVSVAVVTPAIGEVTRFSELAALAARGKKLAKALIGSSFVWDDRTILGTPSDTDPGQPPAV